MTESKLYVSEIEPVTMTIPEACARHAGMKADAFRDMCIRKQIRAQKVGKHWHISVADLDRIFLGNNVRR